jgi:hypothetical protein
MKDIRKVILIPVLLIIILASATGGALADRVKGLPFLDRFAPKNQSFRVDGEKSIVKEESVVIDVSFSCYSLCRYSKKTCLRV